jgi:hypothetical protein
MKEKAKVTEKDFELFKSECERWIKKLGCTNYEFRYHFEDIKDDDGKARVDATSRTIDIHLDNKKLNSPVELIAKHEVIEAVLFANVECMIIGWTNDLLKALEPEIHNSVRILEKALE